MLKDQGEKHSGNGHEPASQKKTGKRAVPRAEYSTWSSDLGFMPRGRPLPLRETIRQLPRRYRFILTKPGLEPFFPEAGLGEWKIVWFQLLVYAVVAAGLTFVRTLFAPPASGSGTGLDSPAIARALGLGTSLGLVVLIPLLFFFAMGLLYWLARASGGHGSFVQQAYTTLLFLVPCGIITSVLGLIPFAGSFLAFFLGLLLFIYCVVLQCFATVVVHQMPGDKATRATIITALSLVPASLLCLGLWTLVFVII